MKVVDLTLTMTDNMPAHKLFQSPIILQALSHEKTKDFGLGVPEDRMTFATNYLGILDHVGTHVDAFYHTNPGGSPVDEMSLEDFFGKAVCLDLTHIPDLGEIGADDLEAAEERSGIEIDGHIVLLNTGLHERHYPNPEVVRSNPGLTADATHWLADRNSKAHGVEGPSTDVPSDDLFPSHRVCRDRGIFHWEWLINLEELVGKGEFTFHGAPLRVQGGSGSPVRAFALLEE